MADLRLSIVRPVFRSARAKERHSVEKALRKRLSQVTETPDDKEEGLTGITEIFMFQLLEQKARLWNLSRAQSEASLFLYASFFLGYLTVTYFQL